MKRIIPILLLLNQFVVVNGSELPDSSFIWTIRTIGWGQCNSVFTYMLSSDTLIGNIIYKKILTSYDSVFSESNSSYYCAARDSSGYWYFVPGGDSTEYLLYNFNTSVGETVKLNNPWAVGEVDAFVISMDSILIKDEYKRRLGIGFRQGEIWEYWIEDVGCLFGLFYSSYFISDFGYELSCTYINGEFYYNFGFHEFCGCWPRTSLEDPIKVGQVLIYPNPSNGILRLENLLNETTIISFFSTDGRLIVEYLVQANCSKQISFDYSGSIIARIKSGGIVDHQVIQIIK